MTADARGEAGGDGPERDTRPFDGDRTVPLAAAEALWDRAGAQARAWRETAPAVDDLLTWWDCNFHLVFPAAEEAALARRAVKVLALAALLPGSRTISPREMTEILRASSPLAAPLADVRVVAGMLRRMEAHGPGIVRQPSVGGDELDDGFSIGGAGDLAPELEQRAERIAAELVSRPADLARAVADMCDDPRLPLARLTREPRIRSMLRWQRTDRHGFVLLVASGPLTGAVVSDLIHELATTEADYLVIIAAPDLADVDAPPSEEPGGDAALALLPVVVWYPRPVVRTDSLRLASARQILASRLTTGPEARGRGVPAAFVRALEADRAFVKELVRDGYARGRVVGPAGLPDLTGSAGEMPLDAWVESVAVSMLEHRFPRHFLVSPGPATINRRTVSSLVELFLRPGCTGPGAPLPFPVMQLVDGYLSGLDLVARRGRGWALDVEPGRSEVARHVLDTAGERPVGVEELYWRLRKGPFGLGRPCFEVLVVTLLFSGHLVALSRSARLPLVRMTGESLDRVSQLVRERPLDRTIAQGLLGLRFLFARRGRPPRGPLMPRPLWNEILSLRTTRTLALGGLVAMVRRAREERLLAILDLGEADAWLVRFDELLGALDMWTDPHDGLAHLHRLMSEAGLLEPLDRVARLLVFLRQCGARYLALAGYLVQEELRVPPGPRFGPLGVELERLQGRTRARETCLSRDAFVNFERDGMAFREAYRVAYTADHAAVAKCERFAPSRLENRATCECGHRLGDAPHPGEVPVRDLAILSLSLAGRTVSRGEVFNAVSEWVGCDLSDTTLVRIVNGSR